MIYSLWMHPEGHIVGHNLSDTGPHYVFAALWDDDAKSRDYTFEVEREFVRTVCHADWTLDGYREVSKLEALDEESSAMRSFICALVMAFDAHRNPNIRDTSRYLARFRDVVDEMLRFDDDPTLFESRIKALQPLPNITLFSGAPGRSRYDFWEATCGS